MAVQTDAGAKKALEEVPDRNIPVLLVGNKGEIQESF